MDAEKIAEAVARRLAPPRALPVLLSYRAAAARLGIDRHQIPSLVARGVIRDVPRGWRRAISTAEIDRIAREGLPPEVRPIRPRAVRHPKPGDLDAIDVVLARHRRR